MTRAIVLDSTPLGLLTHRRGIAAADQCRQWLAGHTARGARAIVCEIVDYELRRELLRARKLSSVARLEELLGHPDFEYVPLTTGSMRLAAQLWSELRQQGTPTAEPHALDIDVILAAQTRSLAFQPNEIVVATGNVAHLGRLVRADLWMSI